MRIAVMSDIHGFSLALDVVLDDIRREGPFDHVVVAGDLCEVGPDPAGALARVRALDAIVLQGNTDRDIALSARGAFTSDELEFVLSRIAPDDVAWLERLPHSVRITPPGGESGRDDLLACHANPHDLERKLTPEMSDREIREVLGDTEAGAVAYGHHHVASVRELGSTLLVDVSAVGNPKDRDLRCKYGILAWNGPEAGWSAEIRRLDYPLEETRRQMRESGMPDPEKAIAKLERASYRSAPRQA